MRFWRTITVLVATACLFPAGHAAAQGKGDVEVFLGAHLFRPTFDGLESIAEDSTLDMWGIQGDIAFYLNETLGIVLEGSFPQKDIELTIPVGGGVGATIDYSQATYLVGPRARFNAGGAITPSVQALIGWSTGSVGRTQIEGIDVPVLIALGDSSFAFGAGANLDVRLGNTFALRLIQASVILTSFGDDSQATARFSAGLIGRF
jgi:hypothetical protein